ncbi:MAG: oligosaccharide flippase family protein, partial [Aggregatilineales bacterium]
FLNTGGTILFLIVLDQGVAGLFYARVIARIVAIAYGLAVTNLHLNRGLDMDLLRQMLKFGFPLQINYLLSFIYQRIDTFLIGIFLGPTEVAYYEIARRIPDSLLDGYEAFIQVYYPYVSDLYTGGKKRALDNLMNTSNRWMMFVIFFGTLISFIFGEQIIVFIFSEQYMASAPLLALLMMALAFIILDSNLGYALVAIGDSDKPVIINTIRTIFSVGCYLLILPAMGMIGAALANTISLVVVLPLVIYYLRRREITVQTGTFVKPLVLMTIFLVIWSTLSITVIWQQVLLIALFIPAGLLFNVIPIKDVLYVVQQAQPIARRYLLKMS